MSRETLEQENSLELQQSAVASQQPRASTRQSFSSISSTSARSYQSWGRFPKAAHQSVRKVLSREELPEILRNAEPRSLLPYGLGRSYGDSCLNENRTLLDCAALNRILDFDQNTGRIRVEAGTSLADLLEVIVPQGWFLPVTPGTKFVTIGGAIANDVHGKNHHRAGTFGCHVDRFMLYRSDGNFVCSPSKESDLFRATIGGLGLTGVIGWADVRLKPIKANGIEVETLAFRGLDEFLRISAESDQDFEYTVAWLDCLSDHQVRGIFYRGNHASENVRPKNRTFTIPFIFPEFALNRASIAAFNEAYYRMNARKGGRKLIHYNNFFYPLDAVLKWNLLYGKPGLVQHQCVVPYESAAALKEIIQLVSKSGQGCFLAVLKAFGDISSPGLLSFPRPGLTLAIDLPMRGRPTLNLLNALDEQVQGAGGALYPAKDARMSSTMFRTGFPQVTEFAEFVDPAFSSSFWRRVVIPDRP